MKWLFFLSYFLCSYISQAQFSGPPDSVNTSAIYKDSSVFKAWATGCTIQRGWQDISNQALGKAYFGDSSLALGKALENGVVSLGDGGVAILTFNQPIKNGSGADFAVFENSFSDYFLELAFVEVSSDGVHFVRFPATSNTQNTIQIGPFDLSSEPTKINNLAGKYRAGYGTPFDLQELIGMPNLDINAITHIKLIDVVGAINPPFATYDQHQQAINDPFPTPFPSAGFDLDAVGVIHPKMEGIETQNELKNEFIYFPNPVQSFCIISTQLESFCQVEMCNALGQLIFKKDFQKNIFIDFCNHPTGFYFLKIQAENGNLFYKKIQKI